jgi:hypothetical protein
MTSTAKLEPRYAGEFLASEANGHQSREVITVLSGSKANAGDVLGKILEGSAVGAAVGGNTGNGVLGAVTLSLGAKPGVYRLTCFAVAANAGKFLLEDPTGIQVGVVTVAVAFSAGGLAFTLADGATDFVAGDSFTITVATGSLKYVPLDPAGTDGRQTAAAIAYDVIDATLADTTGVAVVRHAEVNGAEIGWGTANGGQITQGIADLASRGILVRTGSV